MKNQQIMENNKKSVVLTMTGTAIMILLTVTKAVPSSNIASYFVFVGIAFFFITEAVSKTPNAESGLRFHTIVEDIKKPHVIAWALLPGVSGIVTLVVGNLIFSGAFAAHVIRRTSSILSFDKTVLLIGQVIIAAFGEEIAYRGFFLGKSIKIFPFWFCAVVSSLTFAAGHIAAGNTGIVLYDVATVFIDSLIFSVIYHKSGNCVISTFSHILGNAISLVAVFLFF
ncbi:MAG: CPBP family intramembrane metalloprotease [Lachnospiraceae bacterium]|jgi:membrane protease YdiL (CAAX protease family)